MLWTTAWAVLLFVRLGDTDISVVPQQFTVVFNSHGHPSNNLTVVCSPPDDDTIQGITFIQLRKYKLRQHSRTPVATLTPFATDSFRLTPETGLLDRKYNLSGEIRSEEPLQSFLRVEFFDGSCADDGRFECSIHFHRAGALEAEVLYYSANVSTKTMPDKVLLVPRPFQDVFVVNWTLELHCSGQVGSPPAYFRWQYRHTGTGAEEESEYKALTFGVIHSVGPYPQGFCKHFRSATLWLRAEMDLNGVEIRCVPVHGIDRYYHLSASYNISVEEPSCVPECQNGGVCQIDTCQCTANFTGAFCEQAIHILECEDKCDGTSLGPILVSTHLHSALFLLTVVFQF
ncbi:uncharacterized protein LOC143287675 [Babylonia areolata]|uniref:uncharacterized protein LOC143287675 n=1 Tax=Babylonia areolata TaxID=304850 RepID=UPI003FD1166C